jgi:hypothetical protein
VSDSAQSAHWFGPVFAGPPTELRLLATDGPSVALESKFWAFALVARLAGLERATGCLEGMAWTYGDIRDLG